MTLRSLLATSLLCSQLIASEPVWNPYYNQVDTFLKENYRSQLTAEETSAYLPYLLSEKLGPDADEHSKGIQVLHAMMQSIISAIKNQLKSQPEEVAQEVALLLSNLAMYRSLYDYALEIGVDVSRLTFTAQVQNGDNVEPKSMPIVHPDALEEACKQQFIPNAQS